MCIGISAREVWQKLAVECDGQSYMTDSMFGAFVGGAGYVYFGCGEGCCDHDWRNLQDFLSSHGSDEFYLSE